MRKLSAKELMLFNCGSTVFNSSNSSLKFELWRRLLRVPWTARVKPIDPKGNQSWIFIERTDAETEVPKLWPPDGKNWLIRKDTDGGKDWRQVEKETAEDEMVVWHHWLDGHEFEQVLEVGDGQGSLACCSPWGCRIRHDWATELNWRKQKQTHTHREQTCGCQGGSGKGKRWTGTLALVEKHYCI